jgi:hypothetical protein
MHSPFPGMDPYLEAPGIWPDVHTSLMSIFREQLAPLLAPKYLAELETQVVIDRLDDDPQVLLLDVSITSPDVSAGASSAVTVAAPAPSRSEYRWMSLPAWSPSTFASGRRHAW